MVRHIGVEPITPGFERLIIIKYLQKINLFIDTFSA